MNDIEQHDAEPVRHSGVPVMKPQEKVPDEELPLIVWLRGDEELVTEFTMDADAAMAFLGIKRSRLTQISGRELRVGRLRVDRYIRPVYRLQDLQAYKVWTRAPISHATSTRVIEEAREKLEHQADELSRSLAATLDSVEEQFAQTTATLGQHIDQIQSEQKQLWQTTTAQLIDEMQGSLQNARQILELRHDRLESQLLPVQDLAQSLLQSHGILSHIHGEIRELTVLQKSEREDRLAERERWQISFDLVNRALNTLIGQWADFQEEQEQRLQEEQERRLQAEQARQQELAAKELELAPTTVAQSLLNKKPVPRFRREARQRLSRNLR